MERLAYSFYRDMDSRLWRRYQIKRESFDRPIFTLFSQHTVDLIYAGRITQEIKDVFL